MLTATVLVFLSHLFVVVERLGKKKITVEAPVEAPTGRAAD
jgi:hypothetical protein